MHSLLYLLGPPLQKSTGVQPLSTQSVHDLCADSALADAITKAQDVLNANNCGSDSLPQGTASNLAANGRRLMQGGHRHCCTPRVPFTELLRCTASKRLPDATWSIEHMLTAAVGLMQWARPSSSCIECFFTVFGHQ